MLMTVIILSLNQKSILSSSKSILLGGYLLVKTLFLFLEIVLEVFN